MSTDNHFSPKKPVFRFHGTAVAVALVLRGRKWLYQLTPKGVAERVEASGQQAVNKFSEFRATFTAAMREKEAELREELDMPRKA